MKRKGYLEVKQYIDLNTTGIAVWARGKKGQAVGRVEVNSAGIAAFGGKYGNKRLINMS